MKIPYCEQITNAKYFYFQRKAKLFLFKDLNPWNLPKVNVNFGNDIKPLPIEWFTGSSAVMYSRILERTFGKLWPFWQIEAARQV